MTVRRIPRAGLLLLGALLAAGLLLAQAPAQPDSGQQPPPEEKKQDKKEEKPRKPESGKRVFTGKISLRSSRQEKETASYGFKGVGEDGRVQQAALNAQPSGEDWVKTNQLAAYQLPPEELAAFLAQGGLRPRGDAAPKEKKP